MWALVQALATLTGPDEEIRVAGLDGGPGPGEGDRRLLAELAAGFDPAEHLREANAARYRLARRAGRAAGGAAVPARP